MAAAVLLDPVSLMLQARRTPTLPRGTGPVALALAAIVAIAVAADRSQPASLRPPAGPPPPPLTGA